MNPDRLLGTIFDFPSFHPLIKQLVLCLSRCLDNIIVQIQFKNCNIQRKGAKIIKPTYFEVFFELFALAAAELMLFFKSTNSLFIVAIDSIIERPSHHESVKESKTYFQVAKVHSEPLTCNQLQKRTVFDFDSLPPASLRKPVQNSPRKEVFQLSLTVGKFGEKSRL